MNQNSNMNIKINSLRSFDAMDGNIWVIDKLCINTTTQIQIMVNPKTRFIVGFLISQEISTSELNTKFSKVILNHYDKNNSIEIQFRDSSNQIILDSIGEEIQNQVTLKYLQKDSRLFRNWRKTIPKKFKGILNVKKANNVEFQRLLFDSEYFEQNKMENISDAITDYNNHLALIPKETNESLIISQKDSINQIIDRMTNLVLQDQSQIRTIMKQGFTGLAFQNEELWKQNQELQELIKSLRGEINTLQKDLNFVTQQLQKKLEEERSIEEEKQRRKNRKRLPKRQSITKEIYQILIQDSKKLRYANTYRGARLRLALALMAVTGVRVSELLPLKMGQLKSLFRNHWITIDRVKRGPANHKAFLTKEGKRVIQDRREDFEFLCFSKKDEDYIFTSESSKKPLERESFTNLMNQFIRNSARKMENYPNLTTHSFRVGFITQLWKDTQDIEFVRQAIGHLNLSSTSNYVEALSEQERQQRIETI